MWVRLLQVHPHAEMGDQGATQLADSLRQNQLLEVLILGSQKIGPDGAEAIGKALQKHQASLIPGVLCLLNRAEARTHISRTTRCACHPFCGAPRHQHSFCKP